MPKDSSALTARVENIAFAKSAWPASPSPEKLQNIFQSLGQKNVNRQRHPGRIFGTDSICTRASSFLVSRGCPSHSLVESSFTAAATHSELGQMLQWFAHSVVELFVQGVTSGVHFPQQWEEYVRQSPALTKYSFELQGFSVLFTYLLCQLATVEAELGEDKQLGNFNILTMPPFAANSRKEDGKSLLVSLADEYPASFAAVSMSEERFKNFPDRQRGNPGAQTSARVSSAPRLAAKESDLPDRVTDGRKTLKVNATNLSFFNAPNGSATTHSPHTLQQQQQRHHHYASQQPEQRLHSVHSQQSHIQAHQPQEQPSCIDRESSSLGQLRKMPRIMTNDLLSQGQTGQNGQRFTTPTLRIRPLALSKGGANLTEDADTALNEMAHSASKPKGVVLRGPQNPDVPLPSAESNKPVKLPFFRRRLSLGRPNPLQLDSIKEEARALELRRLYRVKNIVNYSKQEAQAYGEHMQKLREVLDADESDGDDVEEKKGEVNEEKQQKQSQDSSMKNSLNGSYQTTSDSL